MKPGSRSLRLRYAVALAVCAGAAAWLVAGPLRSNVTYFHPVSEAVALRDRGDHSRFRLMGQVVEGSVHPSTGGVAFRVTDGAATVSVVHHGDPPELFKAGIPVVSEGRWSGSRFDSDRIMIRHGNEYRPPRVTTTAPTAGASR